MAGFRVHVAVSSDLPSQWLCFIWPSEMFEMRSGKKMPVHQPKNVAQPSWPGTFGSFLDGTCMANVEDVSVPEIAPESELKRFWVQKATWSFTELLLM
jgi:hypothetical protein